MTSLRRPRVEVASELTRLMEQLDHLMMEFDPQDQRRVDEYNAWWGEVEATADLLFDDERDSLRSFNGRLPIYIGGRPDRSLADLARIAPRTRAGLASLIGRLGLYDAPPDESPLTTNPVADERTEIFVVHGRKEPVELQVIDALQQLTGKRPVVLHERPGRSRTLIEKLEDTARTVRFAVVIATGDDVGALKGDETPQPRPRQNVVLELGFFVGLLGRQNVALLVDEEIELGSDFDGVTYIALTGEWRYKLADELVAAGIQADKSLLRPR